MKSDDSGRVRYFRSKSISDPTLRQSLSSVEDATKFLKLNMTGPTGLPSVDALVAQLRQLVCEGKINNQALLDSLESLRAYYARVGSFQSASGLRSPSAGYRAGLLKDLIEALRQCGR